MKIKFILPLILLFLAFTNCNNDDNNDSLINCTEIYVYGLNVKLIDASNSAIITTDAEITATDSTYEEVLMNIEDSDYFVGAGERAGDYILTVISTNYQPYTSNVITLTRDECHVITQAIEIYLTPN